MTQEIVEWTFQSTIPEFIEEYVHDLDTAITYGKKFVELEEDVWKAIGYIALHIEKHEGGRGYEGGIRAFARGIGRPESSVRDWKSQVSGFEKLRELRADIRELPQSHYKMIDKAEHPEPIIEVIAETIEETGKIPPISYITKNDEWYTPPELIEAARQTMQTIDLDPASCDVAQQSVQATEFFTKKEDGLTKEWYGKVWMNPPFTMPARREFCEHLVESFSNGNVKEACVLINNVVFDQHHIQDLLDVADAICLVAGRLKFIHENGNKSKSPLWGQSVVYLGMNTEKFEQTFREFGVVFRKCQHGRD